MIITRYSQLMQIYHELGPGDVFIGQIPGTHLKSVILSDLTVRGVGLLPGAAAQLISGSKTAQAFLLMQWMVPHTRVVTRRKELLDALSHYVRYGISAAITKQEHMHCGHGVRLWNDLEMMYSCLSIHEKSYPFVLQPFLQVASDLRIIIVGDYIEAYARHNATGFRMNLAAGGSSHVYDYSGEQLAYCRQIMTRAQMPYAHLDLILTAEGHTYLSEISLHGGLHGAQISKPELDELKMSHLMALAREM